jgi:hypothetical protein
MTFKFPEASWVRFEFPGTLSCQTAGVGKPPWSLPCEPNPKEFRGTLLNFFGDSAPPVWVSLLSCMLPPICPIRKKCRSALPPPSRRNSTTFPHSRLLFERPNAHANRPERTNAAEQNDKHKWAMACILRGRSPLERSASETVLSWLLNSKQRNTIPCHSSTTNMSHNGHDTAPTK